MDQVRSVRVAPFEAAMLRVLRYLFGIDTSGKARAALRNAHPRPKCIHKDALRLVEDTLAKAAIRFLARSDGWRRERCLCSGSIREGRLWDRHSLEELRLAFSPHSLRFLIELTCRAPMAEDLQLADVLPQNLTAVDQLVFYVAYGVLRREHLHSRFAPLPIFNANGLCRLAWPEEFAGFGSDYEFDTWVQPPGVVLLESLQQELLQRTLDFEERKRSCRSADALVASGQAQRRVLERYLDAVEAHERFDVASFLLAAAAHIADRPPHQTLVTLSFYRMRRMQERLELRGAAMSLLQVFSRLQEMHRAAESVGYFDEGYAASQFLKSLWERYNGNQIAERCRTWLAQP